MKAMKIVLLLMLGLLFAEAVSAASLPPRLAHYVPGDLAKDRLQDFADRLQPPDRVVLVQPDQSRTEVPPAQIKNIVALIRDLIMDDALYVEDAPHEQGKVTETITLEQGYLPSLTVAICRDQPSLSIYRFYGSRAVTANYLPVLPKVIRLLQAADPTDHSLKTFHPFADPAPVAKGIPASILANIATIKPGMTRGDLRYFFTTEGGISTTYWNHYVYRDHALSSIGIANLFQHPPVVLQNSFNQPLSAAVDSQERMASVNGKLVKVNIDFAPHDADIVWFRERGFWLHQSEYLSRIHVMPPEVRADDIILRVSAPHLEYSVAD